MSFLERLFRRVLAPSVSSSVVRQQPGPMTAHEAWAMALPQARALDPDAKLVLVTSGTDLQADGRSFTWEFLFHLANRKVRLLLTYEPADSAAEPDGQPVAQVRRINPAPEQQVAALPLAFRDSPEVVAAFSRGGVDFVAGPGDMKLEAKVSATGQAVWVTYYWDGEHGTPFA